MPKGLAQRPCHATSTSYVVPSKVVLAADSEREPLVKCRVDVVRRARPTRRRHADAAELVEGERDERSDRERRTDLVIPTQLHVEVLKSLRRGARRSDSLIRPFVPKADAEPGIENRCRHDVV